MSIDLQKDFDIVPWSYLFTVLSKWGFGPLFLGYCRPSTLRRRLHGKFSRPISIARGTRQSCPLSPLIFAIANESLAVAVRTDPDIYGVHCGKQEHKCALFADDLLLFLILPLFSTSNILRLLQEFGKV